MARGGGSPGADGLHTGEPHLSASGYVGVGVHRAARICDAGRGGQILVSNATAGMIEDAELPGVELIDLGEHGLKGLPRKQRLFQLAVAGLPSQFAPPRTAEADAETPGAGTFLHTDLINWRHVLQRVGEEGSSALVAEYQATVGAAVEAKRGIVLERSGDHVWAVFRTAGDAVRAAAAVREVLRDFAWPPGCDVALQIALHSGRWSGNPRQPEAGMAFYRLSRFAKIVEPWQVLLSQRPPPFSRATIMRRR